jgi:Thrombospondin C-terminal region
MGASLKVASSNAPLSTCQDYWNSAGTDAVKPLVTTASNPTGWADNAVYTFHLSYKPGNIEIDVKGSDNATVVSLTSNDTTYPSGKFGFYAYSQAESRCKFFEVAPTP